MLSAPKEILDIEATKLSCLDNFRCFISWKLFFLRTAHSDKKGYNFFVSVLFGSVIRKNHEENYTKKLKKECKLIKDLQSVLIFCNSHFVCMKRFPVDGEKLFFLAFYLKYACSAGKESSYFY